jgi:hypothetical protein
MNRGECRHPVEIWEEIVPTGATANRMGEVLPVPTKVGEAFAKIEFRGGGLLTGRMADSVLTETTQKFTWPYYDYPNPIADKNWIEYEGKKYKILYTLDEGNKHEFLQVFTKEKDYD